jgi:NAD(P)-dependent dehydrogenase (short-subunit alcohol dehydrogenase family)
MSIRTGVDEDDKESPKLRRLANKVGVVTGAAQGIGQGVASVMAKNGAHVVLLDVAEHVNIAAKAIRDNGFQALALQVDVTDASAVRDAVAEINRNIGHIDILVNNAGIARFAMFLDMPVETRDEVLNVNFNGTWNCTRAVVPDMIQRRWGRIINISSVTGPRVGDPGLTAYAASKGAISGLTRTLAMELAVKQITVNAILPGFIDTLLIEPLAKELDLSPCQAREHLAALNPSNRLGTVKDIGHLCVFLGSDESGYITGQEFVIDGGSTVLEKTLFTSNEGIQR